jgi:hypothetical protein
MSRAPFVFSVSGSVMAPAKAGAAGPLVCRQPASIREIRGEW